jgi:hypothetical protein
MLAAHHQKTEVTLDMLEQSLSDLSDQMSTDHHLLPRRSVGFAKQKGNGHDAGLVTMQDE